MLRRNHRLQPVHGLLNQRPFAKKSKNLLCLSAAAARPEPGSAASCKNQAVLMVRHLRLLCELFDLDAADQFERPLPSRLGEEMLRQIDEVVCRKIDQIAGLCVVRPENHKGFADDVLTRHESPIAAVERIIAIIAHREIVAFRNYNLAIDYV